MGAIMTMLRGENDNDDRHEQDRRKIGQNIVAAIWMILLLAGAAWLVDAFVKSSREQECLARGGRTCVELDIPVPPR